MTEALDALHARIAALADRSDLPPSRLPVAAAAEDQTWIERRGDGYALRYQERGQSSDVTVGDEDAIIFAALDNASFSLASAQELAGRRPGEDPRRQLFALQEALMDRVGSQWGERLRRSHAEVLSRHPFGDQAG